MRFSVGRKLAVVPVIACALLTATSLLALRSAQEISHDADVMKESEDIIVPLADARSEVIATQQQLDERLASLTGTIAPGADDAEVGAELGQIVTDVGSVTLNDADRAMSAEIEEVGTLARQYEAAVSAAETAFATGNTSDVDAQRYRELGSELNTKLATLVNELDAEAQELDAEAHSTVQSERRLTVLAWVAAVLAMSAAAWVIARMILRPLKRTKDVLAEVATGDLTPRLTDLPNDEIGDMGTALNTTLDSLRDAMSGVVDHSTSVAAASEELTAVAAELFASAEETSAQASTVSSAALEVSANVATVAESTDEMGLSIGEISESAQTAVAVTAQATDLAARTDEMATALSTSSARIGEVLAVITSIAEQTNLLALNATIESARAGEAGKGFAVVANEVKELAGATGGATADIAARVAAIQHDAERMKRALGDISAIIARVAESQGTIAAAVEEQSAVTADIGRGVAEASIGSSQIAENVDGMAQAAREVAQGAGHTRDTATELAGLSANLRELAARFRV